MKKAPDEPGLQSTEETLGGTLGQLDTIPRREVCN
jgi:hypothetical protein